MTPTERHILRHLALHMGRRLYPTQIPHPTAVGKQVSGLVLDKLEKGGLVNYARDPGDSLKGYILTELGLETELALRHSLTPCDAVSKRIVDEKGTVVAFALKLGNGKWLLGNTEGGSISRVGFDTPKKVLEAFVRRQINAGMKARGKPVTDADPEDNPSALAL